MTYLNLCHRYLVTCVEARRRDVQEAIASGVDSVTELGMRCDANYAWSLAKAATEAIDAAAWKISES